MRDIKTTWYLVYYLRKKESQRWTNFHRHQTASNQPTQGQTVAMHGWVWRNEDEVRIRWKPLNLRCIMERREREIQICTYIHMYIHTYIYIHMNLCWHIYTYSYKHISINIHVHANTIGKPRCYWEKEGGAGHRQYDAVRPTVPRVFFHGLGVSWVRKSGSMFNWLV